MKYILTESQYNLVLESQKHEQFFQSLIDSNLEIIRKECDEGADGYVGYSGAETCRHLKIFQKLKLLTRNG